MAEREDALKLADRILDEPGEDPDSDISILARQFLRANEPIMAVLSGFGHVQAVCLGGRWCGWLFRKHADGQWISVQKLDQEVPAFDNLGGAV